MGAQVVIQTHLLNGNRVGNILDRKTFGNDETVDEAIAYHYVVGKPSVISGQAQSVFKSMADGLSKDGNPRTVDGLFKLVAVAKGSLADVCDAYDAARIRVKALAQTLKNASIDTSDWTITVEGSTGSLTVNSISTGEATGEIVVGEDIGVNGDGLALADTDTIAWALQDGTKSGTVPTAKRSGDATRITIAGDVLAELADAAYDGKVIVFTFSVGNKKTVKTAILRIA